MEKAVIPVTIFLIIIASALSVIFINLVKATVEYDKDFETRSYTKAVCNETNYCQDYVVSCNRNNVLSMNPITGAAVQFSDGWQDPRNEREINGFCD